MTPDLNDLYNELKVAKSNKDDIEKISVAIDHSFELVKQLIWEDTYDGK